MKQFFKTTYYTAVIVIFLLIAVAGFTQTKTFRSYLRNLAIAELQNILNGSVDFGAIEGNLATGIHINNIIVAKDGQEVFFAERLEARYDLPVLLLEGISFSRVTLLRPRVHLWRGVDGKWNLEQLFRSDQPQDSTSSAALLHIRLAELLGGSVDVIDSLALASRTQAESADRPLQAIDYARLRLNPFTLRAGIRISGEGISLAIRTFGFESTQPAFSLEELSGEFLIRSHLTEVKSVRIRTKRSSLRLDARMTGSDLTSIGDIRELEHTPVDLNLSVDKLDFAEFKQFLPGPVDFLDRSAAFDVKASGEFGNLNVREVVVRTSRTYIKVAGVLRNLHRPADLEMDLTSHDNIIHPADLPDLLPGLHIPDLMQIGVLNCNLGFRGTPSKFKGLVDGRIAAGAFSVDGDLDLQGRSIAYEGIITTSDFDPGKFLEDPAMSGSLNTRTTISGFGTSLPTMAAVARMQMDSSVLFGLPISNSIVVADVAEQSLRTNVLLQAGPTRIDLHARSRFAREDSVSYDVQGTVYSLDLATFLQNKHYDSDLSFAITLNGTNLDFRSMKANARLEFLRSSYGRNEFENTTVSVSYTSRDSLSRSMTVQSKPLDLEVNGQFTPASIVSVLEHGGLTLAEALEHRFATLDSLRTPGEILNRKAFSSRRTFPNDTVNARVKLNVRDLHPIGVFFNVPMYGAVFVETSARGFLGDLAFEGEVRLDDMALGSSPLLDFAGLDLTFRLNHLSGYRTLETLHSDISLKAGRVLIDSTLFTDIKFDHTLRDDISSYTLAALLDSSIGLSLEGMSRFVPNRLDLTIPRFGLRIAEHAFENPDTIRIRYGRDGIQFSNFVFHHEAEEVTLSGILDPGGISDIDFSVESFLLNNLREFSRNTAYVDKVKQFNGIVDLKGTFHGNFERPEFDVSLKALGVTIGETVFGQITGHGSYRSGLADIFLEFLSRPNEHGAVPELYVTGKMPLKLGTGTVPPDLVMDLTLRSRGFRLEFLDPFVSVTSNLRGSLTGDIVMRGSLASPLYEGSLALQETQFNFVPLGITYRLHGLLLPEGKTIKLENVVLSNIEDDRVPALLDGLGSMSLGGRLTLEGITVKQFDITANGQLLVMKESARQPQLPLYGMIYIGTGTKSLRWFGAPERSFVAGDLLIKNANIAFPPARDVILERTRMFTVEFVDDTSSAISSGLSSGGRSLALANGGGPGTAGSRPVSPNREEPPEESSFLDNIVYNLRIETAGLTQVRFIFNQFTNEELFADLKGRLVFIKDESTSRVTGELEVGQRSYYKYFKTLQATGKLLFTGDISNPELDIVATYEGTYKTADTTQAEQKVVVRLDIKGTREEPKVTVGLDLYDRDGNRLPQRADVQSDAIAFLVGGTFKDEMTQGQQRNFLTTSLLGSIGSSLLSGPLTELVRNQVGYITSIDVYYYGGQRRTFGESADIRLTGEVGDAVIRLGGRVFEGLANTNVSIQFPMSSLTGSEAWRNLILELERRSEGIESFDQRRPSNGVRLLYRITF